MRVRVSVAILSAVIVSAVAAQATKADIFGRRKAPPASAPASAPPASALQPAPKPVPPYAIVEGAHDASSDATQTVTLLCPQPLRPFGVGYSALVKNPAPAGGAPAGPAWHEEPVTDIRSLPDANGTGWQVTATAAARKNLTWRLVIRVVCAKPPT